jgi:hypothetical protein
MIFSNCVAVGDTFHMVSPQSFHCGTFACRMTRSSWHNIRG